ncbi:MAG: outer membrane protein assembly factor [Verrucomicrobia bacterium]|nr:MAG: outer membrane protein assembly factor [Verrucomicrobiota bacterium]
MNTRFPRFRVLVLAGVIVFSGSPGFPDGPPEKGGSPEPPIPPARLSVSGYGVLGNLRVRKTILALDERGTERAFYDASAIEDSVLIILSRVGQDGFLKASIEAEIESEDGSVVNHVFSDDGLVPLPRPMRATGVAFTVVPGTLFHFDQILFEGLTRVPLNKATGFFRTTGLLFGSKKDRIYTPAVLRQGLFSLVETLRRLGYRDASAQAVELLLDDETGSVSVVIAVEEGQRTLINAVGLEVDSPEHTPPEIKLPALDHEQPYADLWIQDEGLQIRRQLYEGGFADLEISWRIEPSERSGEDAFVDATAEVESGPVIFLREVRYEGLERTRPQVVTRRTDLLEGEPLNPLELENARHRLRRLGAFRTVRYRQEPVDDITRDVVFEFEEGKEVDVSLLLGWGSYEMLRGGVELGQHNLFGRAHRARLKFVQSMKSTNGDYTYSVPEIFGENLDGTLKAYGLRREEVNFTRLEAGLSAGLRRFFKPIHTDVTVSYNYEYLGSKDRVLIPDDEVIDTIAATIRFDVTHDRRDNPLSPRSGYRVFLESETSNEWLGGDINYQRAGVAFSWHHMLTDGLCLHLGLSHGIAFTYGDEPDPLPVNRRYYPGGENTVRGYTEGGAAPRDFLGVIVGAESSFVTNIEFEQDLSKQLSLVVFLDSTYNAARIEDYPWNEDLHSVGLGIRFNTMIGPLRIEYGHNLNPRELDPSGTLHFSIGYPF